MAIARDISELLKVIEGLRTRVGRLESHLRNNQGRVDISHNNTTRMRAILDDLVIASSTGVFAFDGLTLGSPTTDVDIGAGFGHIVNAHDDPANPTDIFVEWAAQSLTIANLGDGIATLIYVDNTGTIQQQVGGASDEQIRENIFLGGVLTLNSEIFRVEDAPYVAISPINQWHRALDAIGTINQSVSITNSSNNLELLLNGGDLISRGRNFVTSSSSPDRVTLASVDPALLIYILQDTGTAQIPGVTDVDPLNYDVAGVITPIPGANLRASSQRIYIVPTGDVLIQYGQIFYQSLAEAVQASASELHTENPTLVPGGAVLIATLVVTKGCTDLSDPAVARFLPAGKLGEAAVGGAGQSVTTLQQAYNNSIDGTIIPDVVRGAFTIRDDTAVAPFNIGLRSVAPTTPVTGDMYLDDGTNTVSGDSSIRRFNGSVFDDISANYFTTTGFITAFTGITGEPVLTDVGGKLNRGIIPEVNTADIVNDAVTQPKIGALAVTSTEIDALAVTTPKIALGAVNTGQIAGAAVDSTKIQSGAVGNSELENGSVNAVKLGVSAVEEDKINTGAVTETKIGALAVTEGKLGALSVTEGKIGTGAVSEDKLGADAVVTVKIKDENVTTNKLPDEAITRDKLENTMRPGHYFTLQSRRSGTWTPGQLIRIWDNTTDPFCRMRVPLGFNFEILLIEMNMQNGTSASEYFYAGGVSSFPDDQTGSGLTHHRAATGSDWSHTGASEHAYFIKEWDGTTPLVTVTGGNNICVMPLMESESGSPDITTSEQCQILITARIVSNV